MSMYRNTRRYYNMLSLLVDRANRANLEPKTITLILETKK